MRTPFLVMLFVIGVLMCSIGIERGALYFGRDAVAQSGSSGSATGSAVAAPSGSSSAIATVDLGSGSGSSASVATPADSAPDATPSKLAQLWRSGSFVAAGAVALYLLLTLAASVDKKHAFYIAAAVTAAGTAVESIANGTSPNIAMLVSAVTAFVAIVAKGPSKQ